MPRAGELPIVRRQSGIALGIIGLVIGLATGLGLGLLAQRRLPAEQS